MKNKRNILKIVISILLFYLGVSLQFVSLFLFRLSYISNQMKISLAFLSFLIVSIGFLIIAKIIPHKYRIFKYLLYFWSVVAIVGNIIYFIDIFFN